MSIAVDAAKHAVRDKLESQIESIEATLGIVKARAESAKADVELRAIANLAGTQLRIHQKLDELRTLGGEKREENKAKLESLVKSFEKSVRELEAKVKAH